MTCPRLLRSALIALVCSVSLPGCLQKPATDSSGSQAPQSLITESAFSGIQSIRNIVTGVEIKWQSATVSATGYRVYRVAGRKMNLIASLPSTSQAYIDGDINWGSIYSYTVRAVDEKGVEDSNTKTLSSLFWGGISKVSGASRNSLLVEFQSPTTAVDEVRVYLEPAGGGTKVLAATVAGTESSVTLAGLNTGYAYKVSAQAYVASLKKEDGNEATFVTSTKTIGYDSDGGTTYAWRNVMNVRAFGNAPNAPEAISAQKTPKTRQIEIIFPSFSSMPATTKYKVTRVREGRTMDTSAATACRETDIDSCRACPLIVGSGILTCKDDKVADAPARYEYTISIVHRNDTTG